MSQLWQVCAPHNPNAWRIPMILNRGIRPVYAFNQHFMPAWPVNQSIPPQEWWHYTRLPVQHQFVEPNYTSVGEMSHTETITQQRTSSSQKPTTELSMHMTPRLVYPPQQLIAMRPMLSMNQYVNYSNDTRNVMGFHSDAANYTELNVDRASLPSFQNPEYAAQALSDRLNYLRRWEAIAMKSPSEQGQEFTLMSYNVLAQQLLESNWFLYRHCNPQILSWEYRKQRLLIELQNSNAEILCLQEIQEEHYHDFYLPNLQQLGYNSIYKKRTGDKHDGCAIFYKEAIFELETWKAVEFRKPDIPLLDRDNIAIVALFKPKNSSSEEEQRLCVTTTHLLFNPKRGDIKLAQLQLLFAEIDKIAVRDEVNTDGNKYHPVIVCGDMNSEPHCQIYKFLHKGKIHYEGLPAATMSGQVRSAGNYWNQRYLSFELLPPSLGITDQCKFAKNNVSRTEDASNSGSNGGECEVTEQEDKNIYSTGLMAHPLNLLSVYDHMHKRMPGHPEITTQHTNASCTVDYIFYSVKKKDTNFPRHNINPHHVKENSLKLLETYSLLCDEEIRSLGGLPNCVSPSDHIPLMAKFLLKS